MLSRAWLVCNVGVASDMSCMGGLAWDDRQLVVEEALVGMEAVARVVPLA